MTAAPSRADPGPGEDPELDAAMARAVAAFRSGSWLALHAALALPRHAVSPLDARGPLPPHYIAKGSSWAQTWPAAWRMRQSLGRGAGR